MLHMNESCHIRSNHVAQAVEAVLNQIAPRGTTLYTHRKEKHRKEKHRKERMSTPHRKERTSTPEST